MKYLDIYVRLILPLSVLLPKDPLDLVCLFVCLLIYCVCVNACLLFPYPTTPHAELEESGVQQHVHPAWRSED